MLRLGKSLTKNANGNISPHATAKQIDTHAAAPQRGFTTKPGVAVATAHPRKNHTKSVEPQRGSSSPLYVSVQPSKVVEPRWGSGRSRFTLPGVRRNAATPGYVVKPVPRLSTSLPSRSSFVVEPKHMNCTPNVYLVSHHILSSRRFSRSALPTTVISLTPIARAAQRGPLVPSKPKAASGIASVL